MRLPSLCRVRRLAATGLVEEQPSVNYRHAFHAGNHGDCLKHALLVALVRSLLRKPAPFAVLDTHAGAGRYDLAAAAARTGEFLEGFARLRAAPPPALADFCALAAAEPGHYPGSPLLVRRLLRPQDRLACCELHAEDHAALRGLFARDPQVAVHRRDGWQALGALLPPQASSNGARRGLVLIDPPFEAAGDHERLVAGLATAHRRFGHGILAAWYPIKHAAPVRALHAAVQQAGLRDVLACELLLRPPLDPARLNGSGMLVVNPPFGFQATAQAILHALHDRLADPAAAPADSRVTRLAEE